MFYVYIYTYVYNRIYTSIWWHFLAQFPYQPHLPCTCHDSVVSKRRFRTGRITRPRPRKRNRPVKSCPRRNGTGGITGWFFIGGKWWVSQWKMVKYGEFLSGISSVTDLYNHLYGNKDNRWTYALNKGFNQCLKPNICGWPIHNIIWLVNI